MENLFVLPTDKPSRLHLWTDEKGTRLEICELEYSHTRNTQNIYITNDEEIKDGEYGLSRLGEIIKFHSGYDYRYYAKIILTTDQDLIKDGVQEISEDFLQWFVKNPSCEFVEVDKIPDLQSYSEKTHKCELVYTITIPQEEPKQEKERGIIITNVGKQETTSEGFHRIYKETDYREFDFVSFKIGVEWQQEQDKKMYSELSLFLEKEADKDRLKSLTSNQIRTLIEQFKKK
jgi:hypothetical protein